MVKQTTWTSEVQITNMSSKYWHKAEAGIIPQVEEGIHAIDLLSLEATISYQMLEVQNEEGKKEEHRNV